MKKYIEVFRKLNNHDDIQFKHIADEIDQEEAGNHGHDLGLHDIYNEALEAINAENGRSKLAENWKKRNEILVELINSLNRAEITELLEDIFSEKTEYLFELFSASRQLNAIEKAFNWILELPHNSYLKISEQMDHLMDKALEKQLPNSNIVIKNILSVTIYQRRGLSSLYIQTVVREKKLKWKLKLDLLIALSRLEEQNLSANYWSKEIDILKSPHLIPAVLSAFCEAKNYREAFSIFKKLDTLKSLKLNDEQKDYLYIYTKPIVYHFTAMNRPESLMQFEKFYLEIEQDWIKSLFEDIIKQSNFEWLYSSIKVYAEKAAGDKELADFLPEKLQVDLAEFEYPDKNDTGKVVSLLYSKNRIETFKTITGVVQAITPSVKEFNLN